MKARVRRQARRQEEVDTRMTDAEMKKVEQSAQRLEAEARRLRGLVAEEVSRRLSRDNKAAATRVFAKSPQPEPVVTRVVVRTRAEPPKAPIHYVAAKKAESGKPAGKKK